MADVCSTSAATNRYVTLSWRPGNGPTACLATRSVIVAAATSALSWSGLGMIKLDAGRSGPGLTRSCRTCRAPGWWKTTSNLAVSKSSSSQTYARSGRCVTWNDSRSSSESPDSALTVPSIWPAGPLAAKADAHVTTAAESSTRYGNGANYSAADGVRSRRGGD